MLILPEYTKYNRNSSFGYTLIEILIGLTIIGFLFSFGYASFRDFSRREALNGTIKQIQGDLRVLQSSASAGQKPDDPLCNAPNTLKGYRFTVVSSTEYQLRADCTGGVASDFKLVTLSAGITISTPSPNPIIFKVLGQGTNIPTGTNAVLTLTQAGTNNVATITISPGGEIK